MNIRKKPLPPPWAFVAVFPLALLGFSTDSRGGQDAKPNGNASKLLVGQPAADFAAREKT